MPAPKYIAVVLMTIASLLLSACLGVQSSLPTPTAAETTVAAAESSTDTPAPPTLEASPPLATPYADSPAAGICMESPGESVVSVEIFPDMPSPRCLKVSAEQKLMVINRTGIALQVSLGAVESSLTPGGDGMLDRTFGEYLEPGVHVLLADPYFGPEIWLVEN